MNYFDREDNSSGTKIVIKIPMSPKAAQVVRTHIHVLAVCVLTQVAGSYTTTVSQEGSPTLDNPMDYTGYIHYVYVAIKQLLVYDQLSGKILATIKPEQKPTGFIFVDPTADRYGNFQEIYDHLAKWSTSKASVQVATNR